MSFWSKFFGSSSNEPARLLRLDLVSKAAEKTDNYVASKEPAIQFTDCRSAEQVRDERRIYSDARSGSGLGQEVDGLVENLLKIDRFLPGGKPDPIARQIGERLFQIGGVAKMKEVCMRVAVKRGSAAELSACWDRIGAKSSIIPGVNVWID